METETTTESPWASVNDADTIRLSATARINKGNAHLTIRDADAIEVTSLYLGDLTLYVDGTRGEREQALRQLGQQLLEHAGVMRRESVAARRAMQVVK
jgi:hypothetical protein